jgi:hypothetical protein
MGMHVKENNVAIFYNEKIQHFSEIFGACFIFLIFFEPFVFPEFPQRCLPSLPRRKAVGDGSPYPPGTSGDQCSAVQGFSRR